MSKSDHVDHVVRELREMASTGADVPTLLRWVLNSFDLNDCRLISVKCFHKAFGGGVASVSPIGGWSGFGGELSDAQVQSLVSPVLKAFRDRPQKQANGIGPRTAILSGHGAGKKD